MTHKYHAIATVIDGIRFPSRAEARRYGELKLLQKAGLIHDLELQPAFPCFVKGEKICTYKGDFRYLDKNGTTIVEDVKAWDKKTKKFLSTDVYKIKKKLVKALYGIEIREV